jgi:hypothetical protein
MTDERTTPEVQGTTAEAARTTEEAELPADEHRADKHSRAMPEGDWQHLWFSLQRTDWSALAVLPADSGLDVRDIAEAIVDIGRTSGAEDVMLLNGRGASFTDAQELVETIESYKRRRTHVVVACDSVDDNPATLALVRAASGALMVVRLGQSRLAAARKTIDAVGRDHVLASITLRPRT